MRKDQIVKKYGKKSEKELKHILITQKKTLQVLEDTLEKTKKDSNKKPIIEKINDTRDIINYIITLVGDDELETVSIDTLMELIDKPKKAIQLPDTEKEVKHEVTYDLTKNEDILKDDSTLVIEHSATDEVEVVSLYDVNEEKNDAPTEILMSTKQEILTKPIKSLKDKDITTMNTEDIHREIELQLRYKEVLEQAKKVSKRKDVLEKSLLIINNNLKYLKVSNS